jgi:hypothetical protein
MFEPLAATTFSHVAVGTVDAWPALVGLAVDTRVKRTN